MISPTLEVVIQSVSMIGNQGPRLVLVRPPTQDNQSSDMTRSDKTAERKSYQYSI